MRVVVARLDGGRERLHRGGRAALGLRRHHRHRLAGELLDAGAAARCESSRRARSAIRPCGRPARSSGTTAYAPAGASRSLGGALGADARPAARRATAARSRRARAALAAWRSACRRSRMKVAGCGSPPWRATAVRTSAPLPSQLEQRDLLGADRAAQEGGERDQRLAARLGRRPPSPRTRASSTRASRAAPRPARAPARGRRRPPPRAACRCAWPAAARDRHGASSSSADSGSSHCASPIEHGIGVAAAMRSATTCAPAVVGAREQHDELVAAVARRPRRGRAARRAAPRRPCAAARRRPGGRARR